MTEAAGMEPTDAEQQRQNAERYAAYKDAAQELSLAIGLGLVPVLGQAVDIYDTLESIWRLRASQKPDATEDAKFDLILAIVGWIPGPGDGVKKSLRLVNHNPQRFAPVMFDLLREVLNLCNIKTSPEALLDEIFNAGKLRAQIGEIRKSIEDSSLFRELSAENQSTVKHYLQTIEMSMPAWVGIVQKRLTKWKAVQPNSSARSNRREKKPTDKPGTLDPQTAKDGKSRPVQGQTNSAIHATLAAESLPMGHTLFGVSGEHIADYYCYTHYGWGKDWNGHDRGDNGEWKSKPDKHTPGKLSNHTALFRLGTTPNDQGIDSVWRVPTGNTHNHGKPYAIVEAKAGKKMDAPSIVKGKKPSITGKLGVTGRPKLEDLLEPPTGDEAASGKPQAKGKPGKKPKATGATSKSKTNDTGKPRRDGTLILVQMSHEWIEKNIKNKNTVPPDVLAHIKKKRKAVYSRHVFNIPRYLSSGKQHAEAYAKGTSGQASTHTDHDIDEDHRHDEDDVKRAVNVKKTNLRKKYPNMKSLEAEK